ncbi:MAG: endolytic transglycosylase MltG [Myxococcota bacterium]
MKAALLSLVALLSAALLGAAVGWRIFADYLGKPGSVAKVDPTTITVEANITPEKLGSVLAEKGLITKPDWFVEYLTHFHQKPALVPGEYALTPMMSPAEIVDRMVRGAVVTYPVTVSPGATITAVAKEIADQKLASMEGVLGVATSEKVAQRLDVPGQTLEGYLFPDTYVFSRDLGAEAILAKMVERYKKGLPEKVLAEARQRGLTEHQLVTLASLIETSKLPEREWPLYAGVLHNRLKDGMALEHRGALAYGLKKDVAALTAEDLESDQPYNTFLHNGLPPGPIASPSLEALSAAAAPVGDAHFYSPRGDGTYHFCPDEECHRLALERAGLPPEPRQKPRKKRP